MRAVIVNTPGGADDNLVVGDAPDPVPGAGEAVVAVSHGGLNFADLMMRRGIYPHPKGYPLVAGIEMAGTVTAIGEGVGGIKVGDRVAAFCEDAGAFAEYCAVPAERLVRIPGDMGFDVAAAFCVQGLTAWHLLHTVSTTSPGDILLIHAIGGGVGLYLTQIAKQAGATVIGTVGTAGKEHRALEYGADLVINREAEDFVAATLAFTGGRPVDKVVDSTGASILDRSFEAMRQLGHVVSYGEAEGKPFTNLWERLVRRSLTFTRLHIGHLDFRSPAWREGASEVMSRIGSGAIRVPVEAEYPLDEVHALYDRLESRKTAGKLLLRIS
jgi:NADPH:quinone reductase